MNRLWTILDSDGKLVCNLKLKGRPEFYTIYEFNKKKYCITSIGWTKGTLTVREVCAYSFCKYQ